VDVLSEPAKVLTVCTGNICRSPAMQFYLERAWGADAVVTSGGTMAAIGWHVPAPMRAAEEAAGLIVPEHDPRQLDVAMIEAQDLVLVSAASHKEWIERHVGAVPPNTFLLTEAAALATVARKPVGDSLADRIRTAASLLGAARSLDDGVHPDVEDPYLHGDEAYVVAMKDIAANLDVLIAWVG
jgi:protein-tyrosine phosphatase